MLVLQVEDSGFAGTAFAPRSVGALCVSRNEKFYDDARSVECDGFFPADDVAFIREDAGLGDGESR